MSILENKRRSGTSHSQRYPCPAIHLYVSEIWRRAAGLKETIPYRIQGVSNLHLAICPSYPLEPLKTFLRSSKTFQTFQSLHRSCEAPWGSLRFLEAFWAPPKKSSSKAPLRLSEVQTDICTDKYGEITPCPLAPLPKSIKSMKWWLRKKLNFRSEYVIVWNCVRYRKYLISDNSTASAVVRGGDNWKLFTGPTASGGHKGPHHWWSKSILGSFWDLKWAETAQNQIDKVIWIFAG